MPPYWPDKPHRPAHRRPLNKVAYWLYLRFGRKSRFWGRVWGEREVFRILRVISRQQVYGFVANPEGGDPIWDLDAPADVQENRYPVNACLLRGWIEVLEHFRVRCIVIAGETLRQTDDGEIVWRRSASQVAGGP
jgi:hypothetical protein